MAAITPHRSKFRATWRNELGKLKHGPSFDSREEAFAWAVANGRAKAPQYNLDDLVDDYCKTRLSEKGIQKGYAEDLRKRLPALFKSRKWTHVEHVTPTAIDQWWKKTEGLGVDRPLTQLLALLRWAFTRRDVPVHPKLLIYRKPRRQRKLKEQVLLTDEQLERILEAAASAGQRKGMHDPWSGFSAHAVAILHYLSSYGARPVSACKLRVGDVDFISGQLTVTAKRSGTWQHPIAEITLKHFAAISQGRKSTDFLFLDYKQRPWKLTPAGEAETLCQWYKKHIGEYLELPLRLRTIYRVKDYVVSRMKRLGIGDATICGFTGHLTKSQLDHYDLTADQLKREALKLMIPQMIPHDTPQEGGPVKQLTPPEGGVSPTD